MTVIDASMYAVADYPDMTVSVSIPEGTKVLADEVELSRVIANLLENARRYGKKPEHRHGAGGHCSPGQRRLGADQGARPWQRRAARGACAA